MNFMFEDFSSFSNFCGDRANYKMSPMISQMLRCSRPQDLINHTNENHLIAVGTSGDPHGWTGQAQKFNMFDKLTPRYLRRLKQGKAILMVDASHEGYHPKWLFNFFHDSLTERQIPLRSFVYLTGNTLVENQYDDWCSERGILKDRIKCIPYACFEEEIFCNHQKVYTPDFRDHINHKKDPHNKIFTFNCLQKRPRPHRVEFFDLMTDNGVVDKGLCSFPERDIWIDGEVHKDDTSDDYSHYVQRLHPEYCLNSYLSVVSEPQYYRHEMSAFNSEKVFKPIACFHPFVILGGKGSLNSMKKRGYRTFSKFFDESYDDIEDDKKRMDAIIDIIKYVDSIEDKVEWFESMNGVLHFNYDRLTKNSLKPDVAMVEVERYYKEYFGE